jgi:hypothetical protein
MIPLYLEPGRMSHYNGRIYAYRGWVIIDDEFVGQKFVNSAGEKLLIGFGCAQTDGRAMPAMNITDECGSRIMFMRPEFCAMNWSATGVCGEKPSEPFTPRPTPREQPSDLPTPRPTPQEDVSASAPFTPKPTPRPTLSALPTRRPTLSSRPTLVFRTQRPAEAAVPSRIAAIASSIQIQVRNETLFDNPKNIEAVVKTIVCSLRVDYASVSVDSIAHYRDGLFVRNITVPPKEPSRNETMDTVCGVVPAPSIVPAPSLAPMVSSVSFEGGIRRLQAAGIDTYTLNYAIADPPATVTSLEPATVATLIETSPVLATSLDVPANSYIAVTASEPTLITAESSAGVAAAAKPDGTNNILMGTLIPLGVVLVGSVMAAVVRGKKRRPSLHLRGETIQPQPAAINVNNPMSAGVTESTNRRIIRLPSKHIMEPIKVRRIGQ